MPAKITKIARRLRSSGPYSSKIIKAGALIGDTKTLLSHWDVGASVDENISRVRRDNVFGKASRSRVEDILAIFRHRYLTEQSVTKALVTLVQKRFPTAALEWLFYFHSARADRLLYDVVTEILVPLHARGWVDINVHACQWSEPTIIRRHSVKRSRKAPVYWLLQSSKRNYSIWLFYHRLNKDMLFKALMKYVEPKIRLESTRLDALNSQRRSAGNSSKEAKGLARKIEAKEEFLSELRDFEEKLRRAANLHLEPDLNDGVVLNIAPLWELVPWKEAKNYWEELLGGKYEWSSIGKQLRQKRLVK